MVRSWKGPLLLGVSFLSVLLITFEATGSLFADKFFPQAAVGGTSDFFYTTEIQLASRAATLGGAAGGLVEALGTMTFFSTTGNPFPVKVTGKVLQGVGGSIQEVEVEGEVMSQISFRFTGLASWTLEGTGGPATPFWIWIVEQQGAVDGTLTFRLVRGGAIAAATPVNISPKRNQHYLLARSEITPRREHTTGFAVANPTSQVARYVIVALDGEGNEVASDTFTLGPRSQSARFVHEALPALGIEFSGILVLLCERDSPALGMLQEIEGIDLALSTVNPLELELPLSYAAGKVEDYLEKNVNRNDDAPVASGTVTFESTGVSDSAFHQQSTTTVTSNISPEGNFLAGPFSPGQWMMRVESPGYLRMEQTVGFPGLPRRVGVTSLRYINPTWLALTLGHPLIETQGILFKPDGPLTFIFDTRNAQVSGESTPPLQQPVPGRDERIREVRDAFRQWVLFELPQLAIEVPTQGGGTVRLGGPGRYVERPFEVPPTSPEAGSVILSVDDDLNNPVEVLAEVLPQSAEIRGALVRFNPSLATEGLARLIAGRLWAALLLRQHSGVDPRQFPVSGLPGDQRFLSPILTQIVMDPQSATSTPLDRYYWEVIRQRPAGTRILFDREVLGPEP